MALAAFLVAGTFVGWVEGSMSDGFWFFLATSCIWLLFVPRNGPLRFRETEVKLILFLLMELAFLVTVANGKLTSLWEWAGFVSPVPRSQISVVVSAILAAIVLYVLRTADFFRHWIDDNDR